MLFSVTKCKTGFPILFLKREPSPNYTISDKMGSIIDKTSDIVLPKHLNIHLLEMTMAKKIVGLV